MHIVRRLSFFLAFGIGGLLGACGSDEVVTEDPVVLTRSDGCGDAYLWAAADDGTTVVAFVVDGRERSVSEPTTFLVDLTEADAYGELRRGPRDMTPNLCNDQIDGSREPAETLPLVAGRAEVVLDPLQPDDSGCGSTAGRAEVSGVVADDGTEVAPFTIATESIGCYQG